MLEAYLCANHQQLDWLNARQTQNKEVGATGLEPVKDLSMNTHVSLLSGNKCSAYFSNFTPQDALSPPCEPPYPTDPDLSSVVKAWPKLTSALKAGIVAMVKATEDVK